MQAGWNITGDTFAKDADSYFWPARNDVIVSSGYNISAPSGERASRPSGGREVRGDRRALPRARAKVKAFIVLAADKGTKLVAELQSFVKEKIAPYKYPREIEFVEGLPKTATGKLRRSELRN